MRRPLRHLLLSADMIEPSGMDAIHIPPPAISAELWYIQHGDSKATNPDGLALAEIGYP